MVRHVHKPDIKKYVLSNDQSIVRIPCYARHGVGRYRCAHMGAEIDVVLINDDRQVREVEGTVVGSWGIRVDDIAADSEWKILGWRYRDGSLPFGPHDAIDPAMAVIEDLPIPNAVCAEEGLMQSPWPKVVEHD